MTSNRIGTSTKENVKLSRSDRLALSRVQHFQLRDNRPKSISDDEAEAISDWSDSDRECCPLSDFESTSNFDDNDTKRNLYDRSFNQENSKTNTKTAPLSTHYLTNTAQIPCSINDDSTHTRVSFTNETDLPKQPVIKSIPNMSVQLRKQTQIPLLPARRNQIKDASSRRPPTRSTLNSQYSSTTGSHKQATASPTRLYLRRETTSTTISLNHHLTKDSTVSSTYSFQSHDENINNNNNQRQITSPNFSQTSAPRVYEIKKIFVDDYDYGRLTDISSMPPSRPVSRQKWGTIVHPPFPLGYQHIAPERISQAVERLSNPSRCRDRHTRAETPSKRYLSAEETDALVNRLSKVKTIQAPEQFWPVQRQSRSIKINNNWKDCGISA